ncbi:MAG: hypothetical protein Q7R82_00425 [Candidatus Daviesbacteria bacterium]|nr:hypothetical protein [Candidatus Daviesbacteria bacterium]
MQEPVPGKLHVIKNEESSEPPVNIVQFVPRQEDKWREKVAHHVGKVLKFPVGTETVTPPGSQSIQSKELEKVGAVSLDKEPDLREDAKHFVETIPAIFGQVDPDTYNREVSGPKVVSFMKERAKKLLHMEKQQTQKAA